MRRGWMAGLVAGVLLGAAACVGGEPPIGDGKPQVANKSPDNRQPARRQAEPARQAKQAKQPEKTKQPENTDRPALRSRLVRGKVVWLADALKRRFGIKAVPESRERTLAIETADGHLLPIVEDIRGRSFRADKRLRELGDEFLVGEYPHANVVQIIRIYHRQGKHRYELDYWCEICAIAMFELKACDCCQGPIELRRQKQPQTPIR